MLEYEHYKLLLPGLVVKPAVRTCNSRSLHEGLEAVLVTEVYAAAQTQETVTMYAYRMQVVG